MSKDYFIEFGDWWTSLNFPNFGGGGGPWVSSAGYAKNKGRKHASSYEEDRLIEMLASNEYEAVYEALGAIGKRKLKKALLYLQRIALYDDDIAIQKEAIRTIRSIGGRNALDILRFLKTTEHKEFIENILETKYLDDIDWIYKAFKGGNKAAQK